MPLTMQRLTIRFSAVALLAAFAVGCGNNSAEVTGKVVLAGKPVKGGSVVLYCSDGQIVRGLIEPDGSYRIPNVPRGQATVTVQTHARVPVGLRMKQQLPPTVNGPMPPTPDGPAESRPMRIPPRYGVPEESGLAVVVDRGRLTYDIDLKP